MWLFVLNSGYLQAATGFADLTAKPGGYCLKQAKI
jgi:hypothetical protein